MIALIPARANSQRLPGKAWRVLGGYWVIEYTLAATLDSGVFDRILVCTDSHEVAAIAHAHGVAVQWREPVPGDQPDLIWVRAALRLTPRPESFAILRPTSPFRTAATIRRAYEAFTVPDGTHDSLRAVEPVTHTPYKMWTWQGEGYPIQPLLPQGDGVPYHSQPTQNAPRVFIQNSSLEMGYTRNVEVHGSIAGRKIIPFFTEQWEGFSLDTERDWRDAEAAVAAGTARLPPVHVAAVPAPAAVQ